MADWNPSLYLQFDAERTRPAADLLSRIAHLQVEHVVDLGCGPETAPACCAPPGPLAAITGIDNSPAMLAQAAQALPDCEFIDADIARWRPAQPVDVIYANAPLCSGWRIMRRCFHIWWRSWQSTGRWPRKCRITGRNLRIL